MILANIEETEQARAALPAAFDDEDNAHLQTMLEWIGNAIVIPGRIDRCVENSPRSGRKT
jgi:hypothetical protein